LYDNQIIAADQLDDDDNEDSYDNDYDERDDDIVYAPTGNGYDPYTPPMYGNPQEPPVAGIPSSSILWNLIRSPFLYIALAVTIYLAIVFRHVVRRLIKRNTRRSGNTGIKGGGSADGVHDG
jgi:hypothetical protein